MQSEYRKRMKRGESNYVADFITRHNLGKALKIEHERNPYGLSDKSSLLLCDIITSDLIVDHNR